MLGELEPEVEAIEARDVKEEEERSSSTAGKDDNEGNDANDEHQFSNAFNQQVEVRHEEQAPIEVEESVLEGDHGEEAIPSIEDEIQSFLIRIHNSILLHLSKLSKT